jgi:hypothetical protein
LIRDSLLESKYKNRYAVAYMASTGSKKECQCRPVYIDISDFVVGKIKISRQVFTRPRGKVRLSDPSSYIFVYIVQRQSVLYIGMTSLHCSSMASFSSLYLMAI